MTTPRLRLGTINQPSQTFQQSVSQAGMEHRATQDLARQIASTGVQVGNAIERRKAAEAKDQYMMASSEDKIRSADELGRYKDEYNTNPQAFKEKYDGRGLREVLKEEQMLRRTEVLESISNSDARERLKQQFELSDLENQLDAADFERQSDIRHQDANIAIIAKEKSNADYISPPAGQEFFLDLREDLLNIETMDRSPEKILALKEATINERVNGVVGGYMKGGQPQDFRRAQNLINDLGNKGVISEDKKQKMLRTIENKELEAYNRELGEERRQKKIMERAFEQEVGQIGKLFSAVSENPDTDLSDELVLLQKTGKISVKNPVIISEKKMDNMEILRSEDTKMNYLENLAESESPLAMRNQIYSSVMNGEMSAEAGEEVLKSLRVMVDSKFHTKEFSSSTKILKEQATTGDSNFNKKTNYEELYRMTTMRDEIVEQFGIDPVTASNIVIKSENKGKYKSIKYNGIQSDTSTPEGIDKALQEIGQKNLNGEKGWGDDVSARRAKRLEKAKEFMLMDNIPTIDELYKRKERGQ